MGNVFCRDLGPYIIDSAEALSLEDREKRSFGDTEVVGWPIGRFFAIHDASQSPGHVCIYDPLNKLMITGDATLEINPSFWDSNLSACIDISRKCLRMAQQGHILLATDCHRTSQWWPKLVKAWGISPLAPIQLKDVARGQDECIEFYRMWVDYFTQLKDETLLAHSRIGEATVTEIVAELGKSTDKNMIFKMGLTRSNIPALTELLVAKVLSENHASRRVEEGKIVFSPSEKWNFFSVNSKEWGVGS